MRRTRWFTGLMKPARKGEYEWYCTVGRPTRLRWDGRRWMDDKRFSYGPVVWGPCDDCRWRGLTTKGSK